MIIVKLSGGLGNQLFQYALGRRLSIENNTSLKFDISDYNNRFRAYKLNNFNIVGEIASPEEISKLLSPFSNKYFNQLYYFIQPIISYNRKRIVLEQFLQYDSRIFNVQNSVYLSGYWQSYKYFCDKFEYFQNEFSLANIPDPQNSRLINQINSCESVSVHFRRGDYVTNPRIVTCSQKYYSDAISFINKTVIDPHFYIFSDDPTWVKNNVIFPGNKTYVIHNGVERDYEDLRLMSFCKHHIIANSTFSWWGAWLSNNPSKIVISPHDWYHDRPNQLTDLIPTTWLQLK